jgi:hypothetical protein
MRLLFLTLYRDGSGDYGGSSAAIVAGSSQIAASAIGAMAQNNLNNKTMQFDTDMYNKQRADAISDRDYQNAYNSPAQQMARFQAAGLNPNLIYGNQSSMSAPVRSSSPLAWNPKAPDYSGIAQGIGNAMSIAMQQRQLQNLDIQNQVLRQEGDLKAAQTDQINAGIPKIGVDTESARFDLNMKQTLQNVVQAKSIADLDATVIGNDNAISKNEREAALAGMSLKTSDLNLQQMATNILKARAETANTVMERGRIQAQIDNLNASTQTQGVNQANTQVQTLLHDADLRLKSNGIQPNDNIIFRILGQLIGPNMVKRAGDALGSFLTSPHSGNPNPSAGMAVPNTSNINLPH